MLRAVRLSGKSIGMILSKYAIPPFAVSVTDTKLVCRLTLLMRLLTNCSKFVFVYNYMYSFFLILLI